MKKLFESFLRISFMFFSIIFLLILVVCISCTQTSSGNDKSTKKLFDNEISTTSNDNLNTSKTELSNKISEKKDTVSLEIVESTKAKTTLKLSNYKDKSIFVLYDPPPSVKAEKRIVAYSIKCKESKAKEFIDYSTVSHMLPDLSPLASGDSIYFDVDEFPKNLKSELSCILSLGYYDDEKAVDLVKNKIFDLSNDDYKYIDQAKRRIKISFKP